MKKNLVNLFLLILTQLVAAFKALNRQLTPAYLKRLTNTLGIVGVFVATAILVNEPLRNELLSSVTSFQVASVQEDTIEPTLNSEDSSMKAVSFGILDQTQTSLSPLALLTPEVLRAPVPSIEPLASQIFGKIDPKALDSGLIVAADDQQKIVQYMAEKYSIEAKAIGQYLAHVMVVAREVNLDPLLLFAVMAIESNFNPLAQSPAGAQGLMQVLTRLHEEKFIPYGGPGAAFKPEANIRVGAYILKHFIAISGSIHGGLRHYVGGAVIGDGGYVGKVLREREQLITLLSEKTNLSDNSANLKQTIAR
jgi:hypothetical protein